MSFLNPFALGALGFSALVAAVYFLKKRPQPFEVSALFLWPQATSKSRSAWRWYKAPLGLLLLQLLILALMAAGLGEPVVELRAQGAGRLALVLDTSASMRTRTENGTRFQQAVSNAQALLAAHPNAELTLIEARKQGGVVVPLTEDVALVSQSLGGLKPTYFGDVDLVDVVQWVQSQGAWASFDRVIWISDHPPQGNLMDDAWRDYGIELDLISGGLGNVAVAAFTVRPQPESSLGYEAFVQVDNHSGEPFNADLRLTSFDEVLMSLPIEVASGGSQQWALPLSLSIPRQLSVRLEHEDGLAFDNERHFSFQSPVRPNVFWVGEPDRFLEQVLLILGVDSVIPWTPEAAVRPTDLLVVNGVDLPAFSEGSVLMINAGWDGVLQAGEEIEVDQNRATDLRHPVLHRTTPENIVISRVKQGVFPEGFTTLIEGQTTDAGRAPVLGVFEQDDIRLAWLGFSLKNSNLRLTVDFPILVSNLLKWLVRLPIENAVLETGDTVFFNELVESVSTPARQTVQVNATAYSGTHQPGFYTRSDRSQTWAVNVPATESLPVTRTVSAPVQTQPTLSGIEQAASQPLWMVFAWLGLVVLGLEWLSYERGWL